MKINFKDSEKVFNTSVQINNGLKETSADGAILAFDEKYGIMFCSYMPGKQCRYGESRNRVCLSYFPASQPTNIRYVTVAEDHDEYCNNMLGLGDGKVRIFYEKDSYADCDHTVCFKDFDFATETLSEEKTMMFKQEDGSVTEYNLSTLFAYLESKGYKNHKYLASEQLIIGGCSFYKADDGYTYNAAISYLSEVVLFRSKDDGATIEPFAIYPKPVQYEFEYKILIGKIYAIYRTETNMAFTTSEDFGVTWSEPITIDESINCRPRMIHYEGGLLMAYNYSNDETENKRVLCTNRTALKFRLVDNDDPNKCTVVADLRNEHGLVNISIAEILGEVYLAYSTSEVPIEFVNYKEPGPVVHGKDGMRYVKLGYLSKGE